MFKTIFISMLFNFALASLTTFNHLLTNQFVMEHRDTLSMIGIVSIRFTHITEWQIKMTLY